MNEILEFIYKSKLIHNSAKKITSGKDLYNDLISELIIIIAGSNLSLIKELYEKKELEVYCYKIMYYQYNNPSNEFYKKYRSFETQIGQLEESDENIDETYKNVIENKKIKNNYKLRGKYPNEIKVLEVYIKLGTNRKVAAEMGIANGTVNSIIQRITKQIKSEYDSSYNS